MLLSRAGAPALALFAIVSSAADGPTVGKDAAADATSATTSGTSSGATPIGAPATGSTATGATATGTATSPAPRPSPPCPPASTPAATSAIGFTPETLAAQQALEARFDALLDAKNLAAWMERLTSRPHHLGSPWGKANAEFMAGLFRSWGYDTRVEEYEVLFPTPRERALEMLAPTRFVARLDEPAIAGDRTSSQKSEQLPTYNAYSADGDVTGELVYVNFGVPADYDELALRGVDVKGKVVIARYGGSWRGIKPKVAAERGAVGCIIYSDPGDDGYTHGDPYPRGGYRPDAGVQRGSVMDMPVHSGDPLTPGVAATRDARRLRPEDAQTLTRIPVLPISAADARPLLAALGGPMAPESWRGALPLPYRMGPGPARVRLKAVFDWKRVIAYDVVATLRGAERAGPVGHPREPPRRVGERRRRPGERPGRPAGGGARGRRAGQGRIPPAAHAGLRGLGRRGAGPHRLHRVRGGAPRRAARQGRRLHQHRRQRPRLPLRGRVADPADLRERRAGRRGGSARSRGPASCSGRGPGKRSRRPARRRRTRARAAASPSRRSAPAPTTPPSCSTPASHPSTSATGARSSTASTTPSTTPTTTTRGSWTRGSSTA